MTAGQPVSVLVVDDTQDQRELIGTHLERAGCVVRLTGSAEEAIAQFESEQPELLVIDLMLPGMSGWELARKMKIDHPDCPIAISSVLRADRYPDADATLPKPFSRAQVRGLLDRLVPRWGDV
jgi:CheY-like chemotaxis protein